MSSIAAESSSASASPSQSVGMGEVLSSVRVSAELYRPPVVEFRKITKAYNAGLPNEFTAIRDVTFVVEDLVDKGEFVCVLGPSGCGKSTILRLIAGLEPQHPADVAANSLVLGETVTRSRSRSGHGVSGLHQLRPPHGARQRGLRSGMPGDFPQELRYELGRHWIDRVGLKVATDQYKYPHELSGGMRQRVAIARTLILKPRIILMDEPFGALDPMTRMNMQDLLLALWREVEATVFFITHSIEEAVFLGDRIYIMSNSPGTILKEMQVQPSDRPSKDMQREPRFQETVYYIRDVISQLMEESRQWRGNDHVMGLTKYLKAAFLNQWNLLVFMGCLGFALLSGRFDLILARWCWPGEVAYLALLGNAPEVPTVLSMPC